MPLRSTSTTSSSVAGAPELDLAILEVGEDGAEDERAILVLGLAGGVQRGPQGLARALGPGDTRATAVLADRGVHLPLPLLARLLEVAVLAKIREDPGLLALLLEPLERPLEALVIVDDDFWHSWTHPSRRRIGVNVHRMGNLADHAPS